MKKIFLTMAVILTVATATLAGNTPETNPKALEVFKREFSNAEHVKWTTEGEYNKAFFILGGSRAIAVFNAQGELLGSMRDLVFNQLPLSVISTLDKRFADASIFDIREVINSDGTRYKFTLEQKAKKYTVSLLPDGSIEDVRRVKN